MTDVGYVVVTVGMTMGLGWLIAIWACCLRAPTTVRAKEAKKLTQYPLQYLINEGFIRVTIVGNEWYVNLPDHVDVTVRTGVAGTRTGVQVKVFRRDNPERILTFPDRLITVTDEALNDGGEWTEPDRPDLPGDEWKNG